MRVLRLMAIGSLACLAPAMAQGQAVPGSALAPADMADPNFDPNAAALPAPAKPKPDPYSINGFDDGAIALRPTLQINSVVSDNASNSATLRQADVGLELKPALSFETNWPVHQWTGSASADWISFLKTPEAASLTGQAQTNFRLDIRHTTFADFFANVNVTQSSPGEAQVPGTAVSGRQDWNLGAGADINQDFGPWQGRARLALARQAYGDVALSGGGTQVNSDLNYVEVDLGLRGTYGAPLAGLRPFAEVDYSPRFHDLPVDRNGQQRNSQGLGLMAGLDFNDGAIWQGEVAATGLMRSYADPSLATATALGLTANLTWSPTRLLSLVASSSVTQGESAIANVSALPSWTAGLNATYAWRDNLSFRAGGNYTLASNGTGLDQTLVASVGADWALNPNLAASATLQSTWFNSAQSASYDEQRATVGMTYKP